jgi:hypothetical protein
MSTPIITTPSNYLPSIWDRADGGYTNPLGTATPDDAIIFNYLGVAAKANQIVSFFQEASDSPTVEFGEQCTITHKYYVDSNSGKLIQKNYQRGTIMVDSTGINLSRVLSSVMQPMAKTNGRINILTVISEAKSFSNPPDEFTITPVELNPPLEKHPRYRALTYFDRFMVRNANLSDAVDVAQSYEQTIQTMSSSLNPALDEKGQAQELLFKKHKGIESFYLSGYKITWTQYFWSPQTINPGAYIEDPFSYSGGSIPAYFWDTNQNGSGTNIFAGTQVMNQNMFPNINIHDITYGLSWLRQTDEQVLNRTWWRLTKSWVGAPGGHWDVEIYSAEPQPLQTQDYQGAVI